MLINLWEEVKEGKVPGVSFQNYTTNLASRGTATSARYKVEKSSGSPATVDFRDILPLFQSMSQEGTGATTNWWLSFLLLKL